MDVHFFLNMIHDSAEDGIPQAGIIVVALRALVEDYERQIRELQDELRTERFRINGLELALQDRGIV